MWIFLSIYFIQLSFDYHRMSERPGCENRMCRDSHKFAMKWHRKSFTSTSLRKSPWGVRLHIDRKYCVLFGMISSFVFALVLIGVLPFAFPKCCQDANSAVWIATKVARRPWAPRIVLKFAVKTCYVLDSWKHLVGLEYLPASLKILE